MVIRKDNPRRVNYSDETILDDIWQSLWKEESIRAIDVHAITVVVENGQVCLSGHVIKDYNNRRIEEIIRSIPGVITVHNHLVTDHDLTIQVAQALAEDRRTCPYTLPVNCYHGWIGLGGSVPTRDIQCAAEEIAASVPAVRGVIILPDLQGEHPAVRQTVQPRIGVRVYGEDGTEGRVYQVIIAPQNRLVTHAIVRIYHLTNGWQESCDYLVPVESMHEVDECGILLNHNALAIHLFPVFNPVDYPFAPFTWQPPYPYSVGSVRWPRQLKAKAVQCITSNEVNTDIEIKYSQR